MCGRYMLIPEANELAAEFGIAESIDLSRRYNIAPSQDVPVVRDAARMRVGALGHGCAVADRVIGVRPVQRRYQQESSIDALEFCPSHSLL